MDAKSNTKVSKSDLIRPVVARYIGSILFIGLTLFLPAGTLDFWNGWLFMAALFIPMLLAIVYLIAKDPELMRKRIKTDEKEKTQKIYLASSAIVCFAVFIVPGFDFRYGWSSVPVWLVIVATGLMMCGYFMFFTVMRQNSFSSRVIEIQDGQKVIDTGLYSVVRHPMYSAAIILFGFMPLVLGSYYGLIPTAMFPMLLVIRILNEEKVLKKDLPGYAGYMRKVKYRIIPYIW